jgi:hypothetical protein
MFKMLPKVLYLLKWMDEQKLNGNFNLRTRELQFFASTGAARQRCLAGESFTSTITFTMISFPYYNSF